MERDLRAFGGIAERQRLGKDRFARLVASGDLVRLFPGVAVLASLSDDLQTRAFAAMVVEADAVVTGTAAAALTWWPELNRPQLPLELTCPRKHAAAKGVEWIRWVVPPDMIIHRAGVRLASPAFTAMELTSRFGGRAIDEALRRRVASVPDLERALAAMKGRRANPVRRVLLNDSHTNPWSEPERLAHRRLRDHGIGGWTANHEVRTGGVKAFLDIAFVSLKLDLEVDGLAYHSSPEAVEHDRRRDLNLMLAKWKVVRFTASMVEEASWIDTVRRVIMLRCQELGKPPVHVLAG